MSTCVSPEMLGRWLNGELPPDSATMVGSHVVECPGCQSALDAETERAELRRWLTSDALAGSPI